MSTLAALKEYVRKRTRGDTAHDFDHTMRVYGYAKKIAEHERANLRLVLTAALLHDIVSFPKHDKRSRTASLKSAKEAERILSRYDYTKKEIALVCDAIKDHSYSRNRIPKTLEGKVLQDADRLDALGAIGIARTFAVGGAEGRPIYNALDPFCRNRTPDDKSWTVDHFYRKLLMLEKKMNTDFARKLARKRTRVMRRFLADLKEEV